MLAPTIRTAGDVGPYIIRGWHTFTFALQTYRIYISYFKEIYRARSAYRFCAAK